MRALTYHGSHANGRGDFRVEDVREPEIAAGMVRLDVEWCGICGSDLHEFEAHTVSGYAPPIIIGHEFAGTVSEVAEGADGVRIGDRVAVEPFLRCHECQACRADQYHLCPDLTVVGAQVTDGGFAQQAVVPAYAVHLLPESVSTELGALVEPLAVGWHALRKARFAAGQTALVIGAGPIGLATLLGAQAMGGSLVAVSVRRAGARADAAADLRADAVLDSSAVDVVARIMELTDGRGTDVVIDTSGAPEAITTAIGAVRAGGTIVSVAVWLEPAPCDYMQVLLKEITIVGSKGYNRPDFPEVIAALADGRIAGAERIITTRIALEDVIPDGFAVLESDRSQHVKVLVAPGRGRR
ncbi:MAG: 2,3-butanediol dehydrogenase [Candidatus Nanopelagicales bacterium]